MHIPRRYLYVAAWLIRTSFSNKFSVTNGD